MSAFRRRPFAGISCVSDSRAKSFVFIFPHPITSSLGYNRSNPVTDQHSGDKHDSSQNKQGLNVHARSLHRSRAKDSGRDFCFIAGPM